MSTQAGGSIAGVMLGGGEKLAAGRGGAELGRQSTSSAIPAAQAAPTTPIFNHVAPQVSAGGSLAQVVSAEFDVWLGCGQTHPSPASGYMN